MKELRLEYSEELGPVKFDFRVKPGDRVQPGDILAEVQSEKATQELEAFESFQILDIRRTPRGYVLIVEDLTETP